jgi:hypothetical protein
MKYKNIDSMLHNFGHSFVSLMNYVDEEYIVDVLPRVAVNAPGFELDFNFTKRSISPQLDYPSNLIKSMNYWSDRLQGHIESHNVDPQKISDVHLRYRLLKIGSEVIVEAMDDRGMPHKVFVHA